MLYGRHMLPTIPASNLGRAQAWHADKLGFATGQEEAAALLYRSGEDRLFLVFSSPDAGTAQHQLAAWVVEDLEAEVAELRARPDHRHPAPGQATRTDLRAELTPGPGLTAPVVRVCAGQAVI
jgi:hypothetical protein